MAVALKTLAAYLKAAGIPFAARPRQHRLYIGFPMEHHRDADGDPFLMVVAELEEGGQVLSVYAPGVWDLRGSHHAAMVMLALTFLQWRTLFVQFEYDRGDGKVNAAVEIPVMDGTVTSRQFLRMLYTLRGVVDDFAPQVREAMATGKLVSMVRPADIPVLARALLGTEEAKGRAQPPRRRQGPPRRRRTS